MRNAYATNLLAGLPDGSLGAGLLGHSDDALTIFHFPCTEADGTLYDAIAARELTEIGNVAANSIGIAPGKFGAYARRLLDDGNFGNGGCNYGTLLSSSFASVDDFVLGFWLYVEANDLGQRGKRIFRLEKSGGFILDGYATDSGLIQIAWNAGGAYNLYTPGAITYSSWGHWQVVKRGTALELYQAGVIASDITIASYTGGAASTTTFQLGSAGSGAEASLKGRLSDVWARAGTWTEADALAEYQAAALAMSEWKARAKDGRLDARFWVQAGQFYFTADLGSAKAFDVVALLNHSLGALGVAVTALVEAADNADFSSGLVTCKSATTLTAGTGPAHKDTVLTFPSVTKRYVRLSLSFSGPQRPEFGELLVGKATVLSRRLVEESEEKETIRTTSFFSDAGDETRWLESGPERSLSLVLDMLSSSELDELSAMFEAGLGGETPLLFCERYNATTAAATDDEQRCLYGQLRESLAFSIVDWGQSGAFFRPEALVMTSLVREAGN